MKNKTDIVTLTAGFYAERHSGRPFAPNQDYTAEMLTVIGQLQEQAFPGHLFDPGLVLKQADAQLFHNDLAVRNYLPVHLRFAPITPEGKPLVITLGAMSAPGWSNGTLGISTEDQAVNQAIQTLLGDGEQGGGDTIS